MENKLLFLILVLSFTQQVYSQNITDSAYTNLLIKQYFEKKLWDKLIDLGNQAKRQDIESFDIYTFTGIAYFEKQKPLKALKYLEKAYQINQQDTLLQKYLFYAYNASQLYYNADKLYNEMDSLLKQNLDYDRHFIQTVNFDYCTGKNENIETLSNEELLKTNYYSGERIMFDNENIYNINFVQSSTKGVSVIHHFSLIDINHLKTINDTDNVLQVNLRTLTKYYRIEANLPLQKRWLFTISLGWLFGYKENYQESSLLSYYYGINWMETEKHKISDIIFFLDWKKTGIFIEDKFNFYTFLYETQLGNKFSILPLSNRKIVISADIQSNLEINKNIKFIETFSAESYLKHWYFYGFYTTGTVEKLILPNDIYYYTQDEKISYRYGLGLGYNFNNYRVKIEYNRQNLTSSYFLRDNLNNRTYFDYNFNMWLLKV